MNDKLFDVMLNIISEYKNNNNNINGRHMTISGLHTIIIENMCDIEGFWDSVVIPAADNGNPKIFIPGFVRDDGLNHAIGMESICHSVKFFIERAKYCRKERLDYNCQYSTLGHFMLHSLKGIDYLAAAIISIYPVYFSEFKQRVRSNPQIMEITLNSLKAFNADLDECGQDEIDIEEFLESHFNVENRLNVAAKMCAIYPEFESRIGKPLRDKIGTMSVLEYCEKMNLRKKMKNELPKKSIANMVHKI
ncbi:hypothetical protein KPA96_13755 [Burkholderia cenocepacia]|uniref:hypothetical protein n=1 Tax=Burkholderia cenocepacia TaxID=95486 RepID=UPI00285CF65B|nr:hypothetical protein [Burkholderia cenocepacia]MDR8076722.1 hypothetical protein [Burkholderia cenocepacia]